MPFIRLSVKDLSYEFELAQKYNVLVGDSGSGKTTLYDMVSLYQRDKKVVSCAGYNKIITDNHLSEQDLYELVDYVIVLDEDSSFLHDANIASIMQKSRNYFLIICRDVTLGFKSISLDCIFKIKSSGKYHTFEKAYSVPDKMHSVNEIVCEDSKSGMQF